MKIKFLLILLLGAESLFAKSHTELIGDVLAISIPAVAYGTTLYIKDKKGEIEFYKAYGTTLATSTLLKKTVTEERPDKSDKESFPSRHTASAMSGAVFIHKRYGLKYALPAYIGTIYTGYSRVHSNKHFEHDVYAGAILGAVSSYYFSSSYKKINFQAQLNEAYQGVKISYKF
jgi:membrane-associated phospholipid phosphatase